MLNNSIKYNITRLTSFEVIYEFKVKKSLNMLEAIPSQTSDQSNIIASVMKTTPAKAFRRSFKAPETIIDYRPAYTNTKDTLDFVSMKIKNYYDAHHQSMFFKERDLVKLRLHRGYRLSETVSSKLRPQFAEPFKVMKRIERLAYRLQLSSNMKVHDVVSVAQLEPITDTFTDPYKRRSSSSSAIIVDDKEENEIKQLIRKRSRFIERSKNKITKYLIRWTNCDSKHNV